MKEAFRSGFVTIIGRPNVGKSTLLNRLAGEKIAIMSDKPQTTRNKITAVVTDEQCQMIFVDTPGMHTPRSKLGEFMVKEINTAVEDVDILLFVAEADKLPGKTELSMLERFQKNGEHMILALNKIDMLSDKAALLPIMDAYSKLCDFRAIIPISAKNGEGLSEVLGEIRAMLPEGPMFFPEDMLTDQPEKKLAAEFIREKALMLLEKEVPHGLAVEIEAMKAKKNVLEITAVIHCEKASHKGIIIGKGGEMLKKIGSLARGDMEKIFGQKVFLTLWVKVKPGWRDSDFLLKDFGYRQVEE